MHRGGDRLVGDCKLFIAALLGIVLLVGVAGAEELWEPGIFFSPSVPGSLNAQTNIPVLEFTFFTPGPVPGASANQVLPALSEVWSGTQGEFISPVFLGSFTSPFIGPDPLSHPDDYKPITVKGSWTTGSSGGVSDTWDHWFSAPPKSCTG